MDYEEYEELADNQRDENYKLLEEFESYLADAGLTAITIKKHMSNLDFFVNDYLLYEEIITPEDGISSVNFFFNSWFPRKAMWSSPKSVNANCTVLKKFYSYLLSKKIIITEECSDLNKCIKLNKSEWLTHYNSVNYE
ncbi:hypothetical protein AB6E87_22090 [Vibrio sp. 10N.247.311.64]|uniref:hypothetical protein n=1 Tax=Vibrio sp. 10N.247.311.64 TaxID=3229997 RepID=UPI00354FDC6B